MNVVNRCIQHIHQRIPPQILELAFTRNSNGWRRAPVSIDSIIKDKIIHNRVLADCNIVGGEDAYIPLYSMGYDEIDPYTRVYSIPPEMTSGRSIMVTLSARYYGLAGGMTPGSSDSSLMYGCPNSGVSQAVAAMNNQFATINSVSTAYVELVGPNTVLVRDVNGLRGQYVLHCRLGYDEEMRDIDPRSIYQIALLAEYGCKAYIYNTLIVQLGEGYLHGGQELSIVKDIVDSYSDMDEMYMTHLHEVIQKVLFINGFGHTRYLKAQINPFLS